MPALHHTESMFVAQAPDALYDLVSDVTRMGDWSPVCRACWWDPAAGPWPGSWFTGRNETPERTWETRSQVVTADRGREFAYVVGGSWVRWSYRFEACAGGSTFTESWEVLPAGIARFEQRYGDQAGAELADRSRAARSGIPATMAAIKAVAESA